MAKTQQVAGTQATSQPERMSLATTLMYRSAARDKDARLINCFQESIKNELNESKKVHVVKRPGLTRSIQVVVGGGEARGLQYWNSKYYSVIGGNLYEDSTVKQALATSTGQCGFEIYETGGVEYLFVCDGTNAYTITTAGVITQVNQTYSAWAALTNYSIGDRVIPTVTNGYYYQVTTDAGSSAAGQPTWPTTIGATVVDGGITWTCSGTYGGFPTPHVPTPKYIDGYMFLPKANSLDIYNSDVDNIYGWSGSSFISAEMWSDNVVGLVRQNNQLLALGSISGEFFYDSANASGSPLNRNEGVVMQMGSVAPLCHFENERFCIFIGQSDSGGRAVWLLEGFQPKKASTEAIERLLDAEGTALTTTHGYGLRTKGHLFFVVHLTSTTLVFDVEERVWHEWGSNTNGTNGAFQYDYITDIGNGKSALLHESDGYIYILDPAVFTDNGTAILADIYTNKYDGSTMNRKFMSNATVVGDQGSTYSIRWSDDDYVTWCAEKTLGVTFPWFARLGSFRRRAFNIKHSANEDFRAEFLEFEVDVGTH